MNDGQRKWLIDHIESTSKKEINDLELRKPKPPSINNYLMKDIMNGTFEFCSKEVMIKWVSDTILGLGDEESFISTGRFGDRRAPGHVSIPAKVLFKMPVDYEEAYSNYLKEKEAYDAEEEAIRQRTKTLIIKIRLGSNAVLDKLISQADNLADISLIDTNLKLLTGGGE